MEKSTASDGMPKAEFPRNSKVIPRGSKIHPAWKQAFKSFKDFNSGRSFAPKSKKP